MPAVASSIYTATLRDLIATTRESLRVETETITARIAIAAAGERSERQAQELLRSAVTYSDARLAQTLALRERCVQLATSANAALVHATAVSTLGPVANVAVSDASARIVATGQTLNLLLSGVGSVVAITNASDSSESISRVTQLALKLGKQVGYAAEKLNPLALQASIDSAALPTAPVCASVQQWQQATSQLCAAADTAVENAHAALANAQAALAASIAATEARHQQAAQARSDDQACTLALKAMDREIARELRSAATKPAVQPASSSAELSGTSPSFVERTAAQLRQLTTQRDAAQLQQQIAAAAQASALHLFEVSDQILAQASKAEADAAALLKQAEATDAAFEQANGLVADALKQVDQLAPAISALFVQAHRNALQFVELDQAVADTSNLVQKKKAMNALISDDLVAMATKCSVDAGTVRISVAQTMQAVMQARFAVERVAKATQLTARAVQAQPDSARAKPATSAARSSKKAVAAPLQPALRADLTAAHRHRARVQKTNTDAQHKLATAARTLAQATAAAEAATASLKAATAVVSPSATT